MNNKEWYPIIPTKEVDDKLSLVSKNPVQNKVISTELEGKAEKPTLIQKMILRIFQQYQKLLL